MSAATDAKDATFESLLAMKRAMDDGLDCEFHIKVSGPKSLAKAIEERDTQRATCDQLRAALERTQAELAASRELVGELARVMVEHTTAKDLSLPIVTDVLARARKVPHG